MCPYPIRWFPVPSVIERLQRSPIWRGTCRSTRRILGFFGWIFPSLVQDDGEAVLLRGLWMEVSPFAQHAEALGYSQDPGQGAFECATMHN